VTDAEVRPGETCGCGKPAVSVAVMGPKSAPLRVPLCAEVTEYGRIMMAEVEAAKAEQEKANE
jgi:hypothetical protein